MSKVIGAIVGSVLLAGATLLSGGTLTAALIAGGLSLLGSAITALAQPGAGPRQAAETTLQLGESPRQALFGEAATAGSLLDAFNYGGDNGTDWEVLLIALADHECDSLRGFYVGDEYHVFGGNGAVSGFNSQLVVHFLPGTEAQAWPSFVTTYGPGWTADDNCAGVACIAVAYKADQPEQENPVWTSGRPNFLWVLRGMKCYQARKDSTVPGGSGSHRWNDPSTWEWTHNAIECRYQFQRGIYALNRIDDPDQLLLGRGLSAVEAPPERSIAPAVVCAEAVDLKAGGTEPRYSFNGLIGADEDFQTAEDYFAAATGGVILQTEGTVEVEPGQAKSVAAEIVDTDLLSLAPVKYEEFRGEADPEWVNTVFPGYVAPDQKYKMHTAPTRRVYADVIADRGPRNATPKIKHVTSNTQAQRIGEILRRMGRLTATATIPLGPRFAHLEEGDWIGWTSARHFGGGRKVWRIESIERDARWRSTLTLREISAAVFSWDADTDELTDTSEANQQTVPGVVNAPGEAAWSVTGGLSGGQPALLITGAIDNAYADTIRFEYRESGATTWIAAGEHGRDLTDKVISGLDAATAYDVSIRYIILTPTDRRIIGPATTGTPA